MGENLPRAAQGTSARSVVGFREGGGWGALEESDEADVGGKGRARLICQDPRRA